MLFAFGYYMQLRISVGGSPWHTLNQGLSATLGITFGNASILVASVSNPPAANDERSITAVALLGPNVIYTERQKISPISDAIIPLKIPNEIGKPATSAYAIFTGNDNTATLNPARRSSTSFDVE
jgi:hypothetical protein